MRFLLLAEEEAEEEQEEEQEEKEEALVVDSSMLGVFSVITFDFTILLRLPSKAFPRDLVGLRRRERRGEPWGCRFQIGAARDRRGKPRFRRPEPSPRRSSTRCGAPPRNPPLSSAGGPALFPAQRNFGLAPAG